MSDRLRRAAALSLTDWRLVAEAWIELARASLALRRDPASAVRDAFVVEPGQNDEDDLPPQLLEMFHIAANHHLTHLTCLPKALALKKMLERRRLSPTLRIGARKEGQTLLGHAWVELDGVPYNDSADVSVRYPPLEISQAGLAIWTAK